MSPDRSSPHDALSTVLRLLTAAIVWTASTVGTTIARLRSTLGSVDARGRTASLILVRRTRGLLAGPVREALAGPVRVAVIGRRSDVSLLVVLSAPILALGTAWWVESTAGYAALEAWVRGTWYGTNPSLAVFLGVALLLALGAVSAAVNSGLVPTTVLVAGPIYGTAVTRYGTEVTYARGTAVVSLPDAVVFAAALAVGLGVPIAGCGFLIGAGARRLARVVTGDSGPSSRAGRV